MALYIIICFSILPKSQYIQETVGVWVCTNICWCFLLKVMIRYVMRYRPNECSASVYSSTMKSVIIVLIFALVRLSTLVQKFQDDSAPISLFVIPVNENSSCRTQQQRETAFRKFRNVIASNLNNATHPCIPYSLDQTPQLLFISSPEFVQCLFESGVY